MAHPKPLGRLFDEEAATAALNAHPFSAVAPKTVASVEKVLALPNWHWQHDQGREGSCVGHGVAMERAVANTKEGILAKAFRARYNPWYDPIDVWNQAKIIDGDPDTNPGDDNGTSVHAGYVVARNTGLRKVKKMVTEGGVPVPIDPQARDLSSGVANTLWAKSVDELRTALSQGLPSAIGVNWYDSFDDPQPGVGGEYYLPWSNLGSIRGGHCVCIYGASDKRQAFKLKNSWGRAYPLVWVPYKLMDQLIQEQGEVALVFDKTGW